MQLDNLHTIFEQTDCLYSPQAYLKGKLTVDEQHYFEKHILSCSMCRDEYEGLLAMRDYKKLPVIVSGLNKQVDNYVRPVVKPSFLQKHKILRIAAFILVLIGSGFFINYYLQYSSKEYAAEEMVSQSVEAPAVESTMELDTIFEAVTIESSNEAELKNRLSDQAIDRKISKTALRKGSADKEEKLTSAASADIVDDEFEMIESDEEEEAFKIETAIARENSEGKGYEASKKKEKEETIAPETASMDNYSRAKSSGISRKTLKGYIVVNYQQSGITAYKTANYEQAIELLKKSKKYESSNDTTTYYFGLSYTASGNSKKALKYFNELLKNTESPYYDDAKWQKALLLIKAGKQKQAVELLNELIKSDIYKKDAQQKLDSLQKK